MRNFNSFEKEIMRFLVKEWVDYGSLKFTGLFEKVAKELQIKIDFNLRNKAIIIHSDSKHIYTHYMIDGISIASGEKVNEIRNKTILLLSLIDYLDKNKLVHVYKEWSPVWDTVTVNPKEVFDNTPYQGQYFGDILQNEILDKLEYSVVATPELKEFVKNDFKDLTQINHEQNIRLQESSLLTAITLGIVSVIIAVLSIIVSIIGLLPV
jgi:hypothetical protein